MKKILVVEDNTQIRENTAEILSLAGYQTYEAENGKKGIETALKQKPDLIVCDIMMPELDGYGVLHLLKKNPDTENIPFIFLTAKAERADFRKGMEMGADDYISKPFDDIELLNAIEIRLKKIEIIKKQYPAGEKGAGELIKGLKDSGFLALDPDQYDSERFNKRMNLYQEGKRPKFLYVLKSGKIKTYRVNDDGKEYITNLYSPGDYVGHAALLEDINYDDSAQVMEEAEIVVIPKEDFLQAIFNDMNIATRFIKLISKDVKEKEERLLHLAYDSLRKRVANALVVIHQKFNKENKDQANICISREDIAQYIGTATESLIRTLSDFKSEKLIEINEGKIKIVQLDKLSNLLF